MRGGLLESASALFRPGRGLRRALVRLFEPGGPFARFPGPVACVDGGGTVLAANGKAGDMLAEAARGAASKLGQALRQALAEGSATAAALVVPETQSTVSVTVVPVGDNGAGSPARGALLLGYDMTLMRNLRTALTESRQRYKDLVEISSDFAWETGADGKLVFVSPRGALGYRAEDMVGRDPGEFLAVDSYDDAALPFGAKAAQEDVTVWARGADGGRACLLVSCVPLYDETGGWRGARGVARDVTDARDRDSALARARAREQLLAYIVRQIRDEIVPQDMMNAAAATIAKGFGAAACRIHRAAPGGGFGLAAEFGKVPGVPEAPLAALTFEADRCRAAAGDHVVLAMATRYRHAVNGAISLWRGNGGRDFDGDDLDLLGEVASQIGIAIEQLANHEELERVSRIDALTGLLNRRVFITEMSGRLAEAERSGWRGALCYLDLDNFKSVNDCHGHHRGDTALVAVADVLRAHVREDDLVARVGGDEFALWLEKMDGPGALAKANALLATAGELAGYSGDAAHPLGFSIGIAVFEPGTGRRLDQLMAEADEAMYLIKKAGKGGVELARAAVPRPRAVMGASG